PGEEAADPEGRGDDGVRPYPEDACHSEVLRRRAHLYAHTGPLEEETQTREEDDGDCDGDDVELRDRDGADLVRLDKPGREVRALRRRALDQDREVLEPIADGAGGD